MKTMVVNAIDWRIFSVSIILSFVVFILLQQKNHDQLIAEGEKANLSALYQIEQALGSLVIGMLALKHEHEHEHEHQITADLSLLGKNMVSDIRLNLPFIRTIITINSSGIVIDDLRISKPALGIDVSDRKYFKIHSNNSNSSIFFGEPVISRIDGKVTFPISKAIRHDDGTLNAVIVASVENDYFRSLKGLFLKSWQSLHIFDANHNTCIRLDGNNYDSDLTGKKCQEIMNRIGQDDIEKTSFANTFFMDTHIISVSHTKNWMIDILLVQNTGSLQQSSILNALPVPILIILFGLSFSIYSSDLRNKQKTIEVEAKRIAQLNNRLNMATSAGRVGIWDWNVRTGTWFWSDTLRAIYGKPLDGFVLTTADLLEPVVPEDKERFQRALDAHLEHNTSFDVSFAAFHSDGKRLALTSKGKATRDEHGKPIRMLGVTRDITDQKTVQDRLLAAEEIANFGNWVFYVETKVLAWSPQVYRIYGLTPFTVQPDTELMKQATHENDVEIVSNAWRNTLAQGVALDIQFRLIRPDGAIRFVRSHGRAEMDKTGKIVSIFGVLQDRTELAEKERELERAERLQAFGQLAGGVAHDFNNLLAVMLGNLELIYELVGSEIPSDAEEYIKDALEAVQHGRNLTQGLLSFSRVAHLQPESTSPPLVVKQVFGLLRRTLPASIELRTAMADCDWAIHVDRAGLEACLLNLAINGRDAMQNTGVLTLSVTQKFLNSEDIHYGEPDLEPGPYVVFSITDTGDGIPKDKLARVFEPFFTTKPAGEGSGLGLARVKGFSEQSGGTVRLYSELGQGTTVSIFLPASAPSEDPISTKEQAYKQIVAGTTRVLIVEDMPKVRRVLVRHLKHLGFTVEEAENGDAAGKLFRQNAHYDLLVTDLVMPGKLQGTDIAKMAQSLLPKIRIIFVTGYAFGTLDHANTDFANAVFLMKPVTVNELAKAVFQCLPQLTALGER